MTRPTQNLAAPARPARKAAKLLLLHAAKRAGLFAISRFCFRKAVRILCYHGTWLGGVALGGGTFAGDAMFMRATTFERRLDLLRRGGYEVIPLSAAVEILSSRAAPIRDAVVITIDDGWHSTFRDMLPALRARSMPATIYCDTAHLQAGAPIPHVMARYLMLASRRDPSEPALSPDYALATDLSRSKPDRLRAALRLAERLDADLGRCFADRVFHYMTEDELRRAAYDGFDVQLHTHNHTLGNMSAPVVAREVEENRRALAGILGRPPDAFTHFCYPSGVFTPAVATILEGLKVASATTLVPGLATRKSPVRALPRFCDGENVTAIELEAELSGFAAAVRNLLGALRRPPARAKAVWALLGRPSRFDRGAGWGRP